ncbi:hypothetical protein MSAN_02449700 [Mycena sanguinolenta]|uniref:Uncharacterized protein n=1 Tax=Mycena sanguinolenta TaxID=230812 RepID=A0A8H6WYA4_9AGAR|nr:hypothetical protein MSAN_02449700 [Mycena sanguinolenta]
MGKPITSMAAVIVARDRPSDRAMGADMIADSIAKVGLTTEDDFTVIPPTPKDGDPDGPVLPHTNLIVCNSPQLRDKILADPSKAVVHTRRKDESDGFSFYLMQAYPDHSWYTGTYVDSLPPTPDVLKLIEDDHDRVPDAPDTTMAIRALLEYAEVKPGHVWMSSRRGPPQRQNAIHLYMPPPSMKSDPIKAWKEHLTSSSFAFVVDCRGRATPSNPPARGDPAPWSVPNALAELDSVAVGTSLGTIRDKEGVDRDGFKTVSRRSGTGYNRRGFGYRGRRQGRF